MNKLFDAVYNPDEFGKTAHKAVDLLVEYLKTCQTVQTPVLTALTPDLMLERWNNIFNDKNISTPEAVMNEYLADCNKLHSPRYVGHQVAAPLPLAAIADFMALFTNNSMAIYEMGPAVTAMEHIVIKWLTQKVGLAETSGGMITSGGSLGNLTALLSALQSRILEENQKGNRIKNPAFIVSEMSHYSILRAIKMLGLGRDAILSVPFTEDFVMDVSKLQSVYENAITNGKTVIGVIANVCSTALGVYDPLNDIADFCEMHNLWLHADAAHGGPAIFSDKYKHLLKGIERADSVVIDFHKMMMMPALATAVLFKDERKSYQTFEQEASYLLNNDAYKWYDIALRTLECTKKGMSLKVFLSLKIYGDEIFRKFVETTNELAEYFAELLGRQDDFELAAKPQSNIVVFRYLPQDKVYTIIELNLLNAEIRKQIIKSGKFFIVQTMLNGKQYLRVSLMNPLTTKEILAELLETIREIGATF